ncbi:MAG TPA: DUF2442 domain-containing protein [Spirochaetota bacterium]|nr:DUF2442 domain-containing protein [Spirochaetota bacterium]HRZ28926.1 DUF2442 domain-containing protein [Spirochaetota bacterium]HSA14289.1 DUF2442 domain-containing protein [Spirochaetota bacterium]
MYVGVKSVDPMRGYKLLIVFNNGEKKIFDMNPYLETGVFSELKNENLFNSVHVSFDTIEWSNGADICPEVLYNESVNA